MLDVHWRVDEPQLRVSEHDARMALDAVAGKPVIEARARLRFGPGRTCERLARLLDRAIVQAEDAGLDPGRLVVAGGQAQAGEDIVRVRRKAHGVADWIRSPTCRVRIDLRPAGLYATAGPGQPPTPAPVPASRTPTASPAPRASQTPADERTAAVRAVLCEVIDPDLGVNIVDLGFVRAIVIDGRTAVLTMTLTSAACPLTTVLENQISAALAPLGGIDGFRVDWQWVPAWQPDDMTGEGRDQLRAIGFTF
jgi:metal-sulfur cluster biosynthetic enzyme/ribosomal protein L22